MASIFFMVVLLGCEIIVTWKAFRSSSPSPGSIATEWNALAGPQPFVRHEFLSALVECGCAARARGWLPQFLLLRRSGALAAAMPLFAKSHSYGEYVFDWAWADVHERNGVDYYPKLVSAMPFTPVRGRRLLATQDADRRSLVAAALELARQTSSLHVLFPLEAEAELLQKAGMLLRRTVQFHWRNDGYADFEDFLGRLNHARRKNMRQERRRVREAGVSLRWLEGARDRARPLGVLQPLLPPHLRRCTARAPTSTCAFFLRLGATLGQHVAMVHREPRRERHRLRAFPEGRQDLVWSLLGRARARAAPAFRMLLLPGDRVRNRAAALRCSKAARRASTSFSAA